MNLGLSYNPTEMPEPENNFDPLPVGDYLVTVEKADPKQSQKNGKNWYMNVQYSVIGADYTNKKVCEMFNFKNENPSTERRAASDLGQLARACGVAGLDSDEYIGRNLYIYVDIKNFPKQVKDQFGNYVNAVDSNGNTIMEPKNVVKKRYSVDVGAVQAPNPSAGFAPQASTPAKKPPFFGK